MSLAFLAKKSWHTATLKNSERVWLAERERDNEEKKLKELRRQLEEERDAEEMQRLGGKVTTKLGWMYSGPQAQQPSAEDYLTGKKYEPEDEKDDVSVMESTAAPGSLWLEKRTSNKNEAFLKLTGDPLLQIKRQQQAARQAVVRNPVKMQEIRRSVLERVKCDEDGRKGKRHKKHKKKHKKKKRFRDGSRSRSRSRGRRESSNNDAQPERGRAVEADVEQHSAARRVGYGLRLADGSRNSTAPSGNLGPSRAVRGARTEFVEKQKAKRPRVQHNAAGLSDAEKKLRLDQMASDADMNAREQERRELRRREEDAREAQAGTAQRQPSFLSEFNAQGLEGTIEERIRSKRHTSGLY